MKQKRFFVTAIAVLLLSLICLTACSERLLGYSIVLWDVPEENLKSGDVLPVYVKSNISHVYIAQNEAGEKIEIPLWKMTEPESKRKLKKTQELYETNARTYAYVKSDGLPCREEPMNLAKQVYRFRKNEMVKILYKGEGEAPVSGGVPLEGDWYKVLTADGSQGWCFSYSLQIFELGEDGAPDSDEEIILEDEVDTQYEEIIAHTWYPECYREMIDEESYDLEKFSASYKFVIDTENHKVILNTDEIHESWDFIGYNRPRDYEYTLNEIPIKITYKKPGFIVVRYTDEKTGKPVDLGFITLAEDENVEELVNNEKGRRAGAYNRIVAQGPVFNSSSYGTLTFGRDGSFKWTGYDMLVPSVIPAEFGNSGTVSIVYAMDDSVARSFDGVLTFVFSGTSEEVNFLYKVESGAIRLEDTSTAMFDDEVKLLEERGNSPVVIYFSR